ncbi:hypothetical protein ONO57_25360, partial [Salmonella enterica subsp. enterica serovar Anatum]|nr:hypothetical protein [Salmonella enterica subsp. enterica serovar Anatum]
FSGMPLDKIAATMEKGMGGTLGFLAIVVALGAMFGKILHETGVSGLITRRRPSHRVCSSARISANTARESCLLNQNMREPQHTSK